MFRTISYTANCKVALNVMMKEPPMNKPYRIGIIGLGNMGRRYFDVLRQSARWELGWVCDRDPQRLRWVEGQAPGVRGATSAEDLFGDRSLDVVGIFTLADIRPRLLRQALD